MPDSRALMANPILANSATLTTDVPSVETTITLPNGDELLVAVHLVANGAAVVWLDTPEWEPTPDRLRVNVNDGPAWNYPDNLTQVYGATGEDLHPYTLAQLRNSTGFAHGAQFVQVSYG